MPSRSRRGLGSAVKPHIYRYGKKGRVEGLQARLKRSPRTKKGRTGIRSIRKTKKPESISQYFSFARYGSRSVAEAAARRWLQKNKRWLQDRSFKPTLLKRQPIARKATRKGRLRVVRGGGGGTQRKHAKAA